MSRHRKHTDDGPGVQLSLVVTPMLDMSFQLLAFFIMSYSPPPSDGPETQTLIETSYAGKLADQVRKSAIRSNVPVEQDKDAIPNHDPDLAESLELFVKGVPPPPADYEKLPPGQRKAIDDQRKQLYGENKDGEPCMLKAITKANAAGEILTDEQTAAPKAMSVLLKYLEKKVKEKEFSTTNVKIDNPDGELKHGWLIKIYDECKKAGFKNIVLLTPPSIPELKRD